MSTVMVKQLGKPARSIEFDDGTTITELLENTLELDPKGKTFSVTNEYGTTTHGGGYKPKDGDILTISINNEGA